MPSLNIYRFEELEEPPKKTKFRGRNFFIFFWVIKRAGQRAKKLNLTLTRRETLKKYFHGLCTVPKFSGITTILRQLSSLCQIIRQDPAKRISCNVN